ncbi:hypothetical protein TPY_3695 [Sulfobacillus acidophilus TPY]|nr:hypothetical protein TPY_3695 [Sulfobacillus acidophilus TPY]
MPHVHQKATGPILRSVARLDTVPTRYTWLNDIPSTASV